MCFIKTQNSCKEISENYIYIYVCVCDCNSLDKCLECSPMVRETEVQSQVEYYQRLKKWYLIFPCLTLSIKRYVSRVKWSNPGKGVAPSLLLPTEKGACVSSLTTVANFTYFIFIVINRQTISLHHNSSVWLDMQDA